ncbi:MAG TPA: DUF2332 domain-containing protein [Solirubrobacteraceae bacterium]|nr:DUF2332 domain-containing protein [Solirubrobacteraceae bacterium]
MNDERSAVARDVRRQANGCARLGSPLYAGLLARVAVDVESGGPCWRILSAFAGWPLDSAYALRMMGAVHRLVLTGEAPALAPHFVPGGDAEAAWPAFAALIEDRGDALRALARANAVQTNEVGRCAALAPAMLWSSRGMPLRMLELGASAGLNLRWDAYRYEDAWGDRSSPVQLVRRYAGARPPFEPPSLQILERRGCDVAPVDPTSAEGRLTLRSFVWPDQAERMRLLDGALAIASRVPAVVERAPAADWTGAQLAEPADPGTATIVFHSIVWQYLDDTERSRVRAAIEDAGARASAATPLAWLRMEADGPDTRLDVTVWPGATTRVLGRAGFHGRPVTWLA